MVTVSHIESPGQIRLFHDHRRAGQSRVHSRTTGEDLIHQTNTLRCGRFLFILVFLLQILTDIIPGGFWDFTSDLTFKDTAYTSEALGAHTDNTYFTDPARLQLFHLLSHTHGSGGATLLVDGFNAAQKMLRESTAKVERLIDLSQPSHSSGNEDVCIQPGRSVSVLERDSWSRQLYQVRWNNYDRSAKVNWTADEQKKWYAAARHWNEIIKRPDMELWLQLEPGTALSM
jgi:hypothetical protein